MSWNIPPDPEPYQPCDVCGEREDIDCLGSCELCDETSCRECRDGYPIGCRWCAGTESAGVTISAIRVEGPPPLRHFGWGPFEASTFCGLFSPDGEAELLDGMRSELLAAWRGLVDEQYGPQAKAVAS